MAIYNYKGGHMNWYNTTYIQLFRIHLRDSSQANKKDCETSIFPQKENIILLIRDEKTAKTADCSFWI